MRCGIAIKDYWNLTLSDMVLIVKNFNDVKKEDYNKSIYLSYQTALLTSYFIGNSFNGKQNPSFEELFPQCISDEEKKQREINEIETYKAKWKAFMHVHNMRGGS